jgi:putative membrane protein
MPPRSYPYQELDGLLLVEVQRRRFSTMSNSISRLILAGAAWTALSGITFAQSNPPLGAGAPTANSSVQDADLMKAIEVNVAEVDMGKMALTRAQNAKVKAFAQKMVQDHSAALTKLRAIPGAPTTEVKPNAEHQKAAAMTAKMTGASFDKDYIDMMVTGHQDAVDFFEQQSLKDTNPSSTNTLASVSKEVLPTVREHLKEAQDLQKEVGTER